MLLDSEKMYNANDITHKNAMAWFERRRAVYDKLVDAVYPYLNSDSIIFDIGANIGYFTHHLVGKLEFNGSIYLFEPVPHLARLCQATFTDAPFQVQILNFGLSDENTERQIFVSNDGNLGWNTLIEEKATPDMTKIPVELRAFDSCGIDVKPSFIKIDVEGAEYKVFRGMLGSIKTWDPLPVILCEIAWGPSHPDWQEEIEILNEMKKIGYAMYTLDGKPVEENSIMTTTDVLFIPRKAQDH